ncbi:MAG: MOSC domain-containing protein [Pseudomonadota bacterium]
MTWTIAEIYRHPVKSLGQESLEQADLAAGKPMPFDRAWAVAHGASDWDPSTPGWLNCRQFVTQRNIAEMSRTTVRYDDASGVLTLSHPTQPDLAVKPAEEDGAEALTAWLAPLAEIRQKGPYRLASAPGVAFTDGDDCHLSMAAVASREDLSNRIGQALQAIRFRMNLWIDGMTAWHELTLEGREVQIGATRLKFLHPCERCNATNANPETGTFDTQIPGILQRDFGHMDFGINAQVVQGGTVRRGDKISLA